MDGWMNACMDAGWMHITGCICWYISHRSHSLQAQWAMAVAHCHGTVAVPHSKDVFSSVQFSVTVILTQQLVTVQ